MVPSTVDFSIMVEVDQIHQHFTARGAGEACGVPAQSRARPRGEHCHFSTVDRFTTLQCADTWLIIAFCNDCSQKINRILPS